LPRAPRLNLIQAAALLMAGLGMGLSLGGCQPRPGTYATPQASNRLVVASKNRIDTVDPAGAYTFGAMQVLSAIGEVR
jgi:peptide/nickel transport system substrate-binding protein